MASQLSCEPCTCIPANLGADVFQQRALMVLCEILSTLSGTVGENVNVAAWGGTPTTLGQKAMAASVPVVIASDQSDVGVNVDKYGGAATTLGQKLMATSMPVTLASDQSTVNVLLTAGTAIAGKFGIDQTTPGTTNKVDIGTNGTVTIAAGATTIGSIASITTSVTPGTAAANLGKAEDAPTASGDTGIGILLKRSDTASSQTSTDGDYTLPVANTNGSQIVSLDRTFQANEIQGLLKLRDDPYSTSESGVCIYAQRNDAVSQLVGTDGDRCPISTNNRGVVWVNISDGATSSFAKSQNASASAGSPVWPVSTVRTDTPSVVTTNGYYDWFRSNNVGALYVDTVLRAAPTDTTPTVANATSTSILASNAARRYFIVQNNSAANIMISISGATLTGIVPTSTNKGLVLIPGGSYESPPNYVSNTAITAYQTSGGSINTISVVEG